MNIEQLTESIAKHDPLLAQAVGKMVDYIQDRWAAPFPSKEQTEAVNDYLRSVHADKGGVLNETDIAHRKIASEKITINAIRLLDHDQLDRLQDVLNHIAEDREYYMPEKRYGMGR
ncbi:hypothetical protein [Phocaeicola coprophilus]|uniref:hypothetical protein n=1 Tax=Phocaeicola coprophilus TaxID=387090 RepID=UPI00265A21F0|nr:hypothetical protein [Phocaeicola coprophilus]